MSVSKELWKAAERLHSAALRVLRLVRAADRTAGVGPLQLSALSVLVFAGAIPLKRLAEVEQVSAATMSRVVTTLERKKLVTRVRDEKDRRVWHLAATIKGRKLLLKGRDKRVKMLAERIILTEGVDAKAVVMFAGVMEKILYGKTL